MFGLQRIILNFNKNMIMHVSWHSSLYYGCFYEVGSINYYVLTLYADDTFSWISDFDVQIRIGHMGCITA